MIIFLGLLFLFVAGLCKLGVFVSLVAWLLGVLGVIEPISFMYVVYSCLGFFLSGFLGAACYVKGGA